MTDPFAKAINDIYNTALGTNALYIPAAGAQIPCRVILTRGVEIHPSSSIVDQVVEIGNTIEAQLAEIRDEPKRGEIFIINPDSDRVETFTVQSIAKNDGTEVLMIVT